MPTSATIAVTAAASLALNRPNIASLPLITSSPIRTTSTTSSRNRKVSRISCQVAVPTDVSSSSSSPPLSDEELEAESKVGKRIRVKVPLKVYHVMKAPDLDINGMEGVIKQYVCIWKGKRISANLPFKVQFLVPVEGQPAPVKFFVHLKEDEFDLLDE